MFTGWSIRRRLVLITVGVGIAIVAIVAALALDTMSGILNTQTQTALIGRTQTLANALDAEMRGLASTASTLAASLSSRTGNPVSLLWTQASNTLTAPGSPIYRIGAVTPFREGSQTIIVTRPFSGQSPGPLVNLYSQDNAPDAWLEQIADDEQITWYGPQSAYFFTFGDPVIEITAPFVSQSGRITGHIWLDVPITHIADDMSTLIRAAETTQGRYGYNVLVDSRGVPIAGYGLPAETFSGQQTGEALLNHAPLRALVLDIQADDDGYMSAADPLNRGREAYIVRSPLASNGWSLVTVVPTSLLASSLQRSTFLILIVAIFGVLGLGFLVYQFAKVTVAGPLTSMAVAAEEIGSGDMRYQVGYTDRGDEIGKLARALEDMKINLSQSYEELSLWGRRLEKRVAERTIELDAARREAQSTAAELQAVYDASLSVVSEYYLQIILQKLAERAQGLLSATYVGVWLITDDGQRLQLVATTSPDRSHVNDTIGLNEGLAGIAVSTLSPVRVNDYPHWPQRIGWTDADIYSTLCLPLAFSAKPVGAIVVGRGKDTPSFEDDDQRLLELLANLASPVVRNGQLYEQVETAQKQAERANHVKTRFLASVTHELRTPLNLVINNMDFMRVGVFGEVNAEQRTRLDQTIRSAEHLLYLINDLLDVSKIEAGEMQMFFQPTDLYPILEDTLDSILAQIGEDMNVTLIPVINEKLPQVTVDARRLRQVLLNLLSNAVKFTPHGEVRFEIRPHSDTIEFVVADTGIGIPPEEIDLIFEAFERSKPSKQMGIEGTGLGLPISRYLVQAHGGTLTVNSEVGKGSTFTVTLPLQPPAREGDKPLTAAFMGQGD